MGQNLAFLFLELLNQYCKILEKKNRIIIWTTLNFEVKFSIKDCVDFVHRLTGLILECGRFIAKIDAHRSIRMSAK